MKKNLAFISVILMSLSSLAEIYSASVLSIHDGDTMTIQLDDPTQREMVRGKVRMLGLDTPEVDFGGSSQGQAALTARDRLQQIVPRGAKVIVDTGLQGADRHGRLLGRVIYQGIDINRQMLAEGMGVVYFIDPREKRVVDDYIAAAEQAEASSLGVYALIKSENLEAPYDFRLKVKRQTGRNLIGDFRTKKIYSTENADQVPLSRRIFFSDSFLANELGYQVR